MDESTTTELDADVEVDLDAGPRRRTVVGESGWWLLVIWSLTPAAWLCADWLFRVPPVWGTGFLLILGFYPWILIGGLIALINTAFTRNWRTLLTWFGGALAGIVATLLVLQVPLRWTLPTAVRSNWARNADAALASEDDWYSIPEAYSLDQASYYVRASSVAPGGDGILVDEYGSEIEVAPWYQVHDDRRWITYPVDEGWWFVFRHK